LMAAASVFQWRRRRTKARWWGQREMQQSNRGNRARVGWQQEVIHR
jgi:hypothetical protein